MKKSMFKKSLLIYTIVLLALVIIFQIYIFITLNTYEKNQTGKFLKSAITSISDEKLTKYLTDASLDQSLLVDYKKMINSNDLVFSPSKNDEFTVSLNNRILFTVKTKVVDEVTKLGLFTYAIREVTDIIPELSRGLVYYDVEIPSNYRLFVGDKEYTADGTKSNYKDLDFMYHNDSMPKLTKYEVNNLSKEEQVKVLDFMGNKVDLKQSKNSYKVDKYYFEASTYEEAASYLDGEIDIWDIAHTWSLFLTRDLKGAHYGLNTVREFLISGTNMDKMAYNWSHSIDITFTSRHTLKNPIWSNEKLTNFKIYGKNAFSCEVYTEKNMVLTKTGEDRVDIMHDYLYFIKENGTWKLINIKSVVDENND